MRLILIYYVDNKYQKADPNTLRTTQALSSDGFSLRSIGENYYRQYLKIHFDSLSSTHDIIFIFSPSLNSLWFPRSLFLMAERCWCLYRYLDPSFHRFLSTHQPVCCRQGRACRWLALCWPGCGWIRDWVKSCPHPGTLSVHPQTKVRDYHSGAPSPVPAPRGGPDGR